MTTLAEPAAGVLPSPCVGVCRLDPDTGWCLGCGRDAAELTAWRELPAAAQMRVWADLPRRKALLGLGFRLLPWQGEALLDHLAALGTIPGTTWRSGVHGAGAELAAGPTAERSVDSLLLRARDGGALRLTVPDGVRAFELVGASGRVDRLVLALHRTRLPREYACAVAELGPDQDALDPACRGERLFDLGLDRPPIRFCVRTADPSLVTSLRAAMGADAFAPASGLVPRLLAVSPDRVVLSPVGRLEVSGPILRAGAGSHSYLHPHLLAERRPPALGAALPDRYLPCATLLLGR